MYSAVLMLTLTAGADSVEFGRRCHGCDSCACYTCAAPVAVVCSCGGYACGGCHARHHRCHGCSVCSCGGLFSRHRHGCCCPVVYTCGCAAPVGPAPMPPGGEPLKKPRVTSVVAPATILVSLPSGARLSVDGSPLSNSTSDRRTLVTPDLEVGQTYVYTIRAELGKLGQTQQVTVRGGQTSTVQFNFASQTVASR